MNHHHPRRPRVSSSASQARRRARLGPGDINRIIADVSKGSKFYEASSPAKQFSYLMIKSGVDLQKIEASLHKLESERDLSQTIVHFDLDSFFAVSRFLMIPHWQANHLRRPQVGHTVLSTASYEARKYGVRSGMASFIAKKLCPQLIMKVMAICKRYDPQMRYLNITAYCAEHDLSADACVEHLRSAVFTETKLTVSAGIAPNTMLAKICSDKNKPNGQFHLPFNSEAIITFMRDLPIRRVPGIGRVSERLLESIDIKTCGDIYTHRATLSLMDKQFGLMHLLCTHLGIASNSVQPPQREERKSIGAERTFPPLGDKQKILEKLDEVCAELESDMEETQWTGRTITLKYKLDSFEVFTRAKSSNRWISKKEDLFAVGQELLLPELPLTIRLIGLRVTKLKDLRAESDPSIGIKRFFDSPSSSSPNKKRRVSTSEEDEAIQDPVGTLPPQPDALENTKPTSSRTGKPESKSRQLPSEREMHTCPVCQSKVPTENEPSMHIWIRA
ncbi:hypothetical protein B0H13DRAFT_2248945 [Mycena leptocephala]|nr:hypothetical protein B0H13DRAFT_2248945 [Mycena leptocephala]